MKELAARAVLKDVRRNGHDTVELRHHDKNGGGGGGGRGRGGRSSFIFWCSVCSTRCHSDAALLDHLRGSTHAKRLRAARLSQPWPLTLHDYHGRLFSFADPASVADPHALRRVGCGRVCVRLAGTPSEPPPPPPPPRPPSVTAVWCYWLGRNPRPGADPDADADADADPVPDGDYAVLTFPYTRALGRAADMADDLGAGGSRDLFPISEAERETDRVCFICQQELLPGKDVATLLNRRTGLVSCSSRNRHGAFHVFHTSCLVDWVLLCETKRWLSCRGRAKGRGRGRGRGRGKQKKLRLANLNDNLCVSVFCPECQGTGINPCGSELEVPRYKLSQVFDWVLELLQSRKSWIEHPEQVQECATGLLFSPTESEGNVQSLLLLHFYSATTPKISAVSTPGQVCTTCND